jgi:hypothetical protein
VSEFPKVDERLYEMAGEFLMEKVDLGDALSDRELEQLRRRAALAMQQAIEAECEAIWKELQG